MVEPIDRKYRKGENVRIVNIPEDDVLYHATGTYARTSTSDGYLVIVLLDNPTETHLAATLPVVCIEPAGPKSYVSEEMIDEAMFIQGLRSDRHPMSLDRHWMEQSLKAAFQFRLTGSKVNVFPNAPGLSDMLRGDK